MSSEVEIGRGGKGQDTQSYCCRKISTFLMSSLQVCQSKQIRFSSRLPVQTSGYNVQEAQLFPFYHITLQKVTLLEFGLG